jgi:hypothetical protein
MIESPPSSSSSSHQQQQQLEIRRPSNSDSEQTPLAISYEPSIGKSFFIL